MTNEIEKTGRPWWAAFGLLGLLVSHFVPFSTSGPAMSCYEKSNQVLNKLKTQQFSDRHDADAQKVISYLAASDFSFRNLSVNNGIVTMVFITNYRNLSFCFSDFIAIDPSIVVIQVEPRHDRSDRVTKIY